MAFFGLIILGAAAGFSICLGLPVARMEGVSPGARGMLNAASAGILLFLLVEVMGDASGAAGGKVLGALAGTGDAQSALLYSALLAIGVALGLLGPVWFEQRFISSRAGERAGSMTGARARRIATMIAAGIGLHNFSEGLAIGQSYAGGAVPLALLLAAGFRLHNATEGFGIASPLAGFRPSWKFLVLMGLIGGGPTFLGAALGGFWVSQAISTLFLSLAAGAIIYVVKELLYHGRTHGEGLGAMGFLVLGFLAMFGTDLAIKFAAGG
ncbi:MAG: ZIP family metal transporter [Candidatus Marsarchaeota archaeon]|nr:ZIP family metal transporter [Candidatus Marsarchaeota archaeon]